MGVTNTARLSITVITQSVCSRKVYNKMLKIILDLVILLSLIGLAVVIVRLLQVGISIVIIYLGAALHSLFTRKKQQWSPPSWLVIAQLFIFQWLGIAITVKGVSYFFKWGWLYTISSWAYVIMLILAIANIIILFSAAAIHGKFNLLGED